MHISPEQVERGLRRLESTLDVWGPVCVALSESEKAMREARFILLGGPGALLTRAEQAVAVLEAGIAEVHRVIADGDEEDS